MEVIFESVEENTRKAYERFFFEKICLMNVANRQNFTIPLPQIDGLFFTSVQDTVERLTDLSGRTSIFQWRNCIFAPINRTTKLKDVYEKIFNQLKSRVPSLFVRSYVYLIFIKVDSNHTPSFDYSDDSQASKIAPGYDDFQIYYWNTNYQVKRASKADLFDVSPKHKKVEAERLNTENARKLDSGPEKLFIVQNPAYELQRIQDANSDIIDAFRSFYKMLPLVDQTKQYLDKITEELDKNFNTRILVEGPARSGKTVLAMSLLARYPHSKMLLMNWYFYEALIEAFKVFSQLSKNEIEQLFKMPDETEKSVTFNRRRLAEFNACKSDSRVIEVALRAIDISSNPDLKLPKWRKYPPTKDKKNIEWRAAPVQKSIAGDLIPVIKISGNATKIKIVEVLELHGDDSATVREVSGLSEFTIDYREQLLEYKRHIESGRAHDYLAKILKDISDVLHNSPQRFFHHDLAKPEGCWIIRGNPTSCNITNQDLIICDEVQRLGSIFAIANRDKFDETEAVFENSRQSFLCGDDFQMLNRNYDKGISRIEEVAGKDIYRLALPDSVGVPAEVGQLIKYLLGEHATPERSSGFEVQLLYRDDVKLVELFEADGSTKKHYAIPNNSGFYIKHPYILRTRGDTAKCTEECKPYCDHKKITMLTEELRDKFQFFCSEAIMPNYALSAYELISREVESVYLKIPEEITFEKISQPIAGKNSNHGDERNWEKQHLYVLMSRATMRLVVNVEDRALYEDLSKRLREVNIQRTQ